MKSIPNQPTKEERRRMVYDLLQEANRPEDYPYLLEALSPPTEITHLAPLGSGKPIRVGIIGGGVAGQAAAFELRKLGYEITIFDAQERIGGRIYTHYFDRNQRYYGELGAMRLPISHETLWHYIDLFDLETKPFVQSTPADVFYIRDRHACNDPLGLNLMQNIYPAFDLTPQERVTPWETFNNRVLDPPLLSLSPQVRQEIIQIKKNYSPEIVQLDALKIRDLYERAGLSRGAIALLGNLSPLVGEFFYTSTMELYQEIYSLDFQSLYRIEGGMAKLPLAFYQSLTHPQGKNCYPNIPSSMLGKVTWMGGHWIEKIQQSHWGGPITLYYKNTKRSKTYHQTFDYIICAIPFSTLRHVDLCPIFSSDKMQAIQELTYENSFKSAHLYKKRFWENPHIPCGPKFGGSAATDRPVTSLWYHSDHSHYIGTGMLPPPEPGVLLATYNFALDAIRLGNLPNSRRLKETLRQIEEIHCLPQGYLDSLLLGHKSINWDNEEWFLGAFAYYSPGQKNTFSWSAKKSEYQNRIFFAGEHVSGKHAWIQGALKTGMEAATEVVLDVQNRRYQ